MGFLKKLFANQIISTFNPPIGTTRGGYFPNGKVRKSKKDGLLAITIFGNRFDDYTFNANDVIASECVGAATRYDQILGYVNIYDYIVEFADGKNAVIRVDGDASREALENVIF